MHSRLRDPNAVDDVMQEITLACLKGQNRLKDRSKLAPWLYRIAVRQVLQYRRAAGRRRAFQERLLEGAVDETIQAHDALDWLLSDEANELVRRAIGELPELDAQMFLLKYLHQFTYRQIAERLGISRSAVESRLHRVRKILRKQLRSQGIVTT